MKSDRRGLSLDDNNKKNIFRNKSIHIDIIVVRMHLSVDSVVHKCTIHEDKYSSTGGDILRGKRGYN